MNKKIKIEDKIISDACEALIGAIYLDQGFSVTEKCVLKIWNHFLEKSNVTIKGDLIKSAFLTSTMGVSYKLKLPKNI